MHRISSAHCRCSRCGLTVGREMVDGKVFWRQRCGSTAHAHPVRRVVAHRTPGQRRLHQTRLWPEPIASLPACLRQSLRRSSTARIGATRQMCCACGPYRGSCHPSTVGAGAELSAAGSEGRRRYREDTAAPGPGRGADFQRFDWRFRDAPPTSEWPGALAFCRSAGCAA